MAATKEKTRVIPARYLERFDYEVGDVPLVCWLDYEAGDSAVGMPPNAWLVHAFVGDSPYDIESLLPNSLILTIESEAACYLSEN